MNDDFEGLFNFNKPSDGKSNDAFFPSQNFKQGKNMMKFLNWKIMLAGAALMLLLMVSPLMFGINDAGHRTVIQYPGGTLSFKFDPGLFWQGFGEVTVYNDVITFDFDKSANASDSTIDQEGIAVRYQDGGTGTVYGIARFRLPVDAKSMELIHKEFRSNDGVAFKIIKNTTEEVMNHTAGLMTSEESYAEKRGTYTQWAKTQLTNGKFATRQKEVITTEAGFEFCLQDHLTPAQNKECRNVKKTTKMIPIIATKDGMEQYVASDLKQYNITVSGFNMIDWGYEKKTLDQIATKRQATMAIITSKANAEKAKQDAITAEQQGLANVMQAKYEKEVEKEKAIVDAQRVKEIAVIDAQKLVEVAEQQKLEQVQKKLAMLEYEKAEKARGRGDAAYKEMVMKADGALAQKLEAWKAVNFKYAQEFGKQKWVPEIQMGAGAEGANTSSATDLINMLNVKTAKQLSLDMKMTGK